MVKTVRSVMVLGVLALTGCYRTVVIDTPAVRAGTKGEDTGVSWFGVTSVNTQAGLCTQGIARAETYMPFWAGLVSVVTLGIVAPMTTQYECAVKSEAPAPAQPAAPLAPSSAQ